jgi:hypothetical protein
MDWMSVVVSATLVSAVSMSAEARPLDAEETAICNWGGGMANLSQMNLLQGKRLAQLKADLKQVNYPKDWMPEMAQEIAEITYEVKSKSNPDKVEKDYVHDCVQHVLAN